MQTVELLEKMYSKELAKKIIAILYTLPTVTLKPIAVKKEFNVFTSLSSKAELVADISWVYEKDGRMYQTRGGIQLETETLGGIKKALKEKLPGGAKLLTFTLHKVQLKEMD